MVSLILHIDGVARMRTRAQGRDRQAIDQQPLMAASVQTSSQAPSYAVTLGRATSASARAQGGHGEWPRAIACEAYAALTREVELARRRLIVAKTEPLDVTPDVEARTRRRARWPRS